MAQIRVALCQLNPTVGDIPRNTEKVLAALHEAEAAGADLAVFSELVLTGYPPEDLLLKPRFVADNIAALQKVAAATRRCVAVVGFVDEKVGLYNAAAVCGSGQVHGIYHKRVLPNYSVFDDQRYFAAGGADLQLYEIAGIRVGVTICEDIWVPVGPLAEEAAGGAELVVNPSASPYYANRLAERRRTLGTRAEDAACTLVYVNQVGGQDELVFDGGSMVFDADGRVVASARQFDEQVLVTDVQVLPVVRKALGHPNRRSDSPLLPVASISGDPLWRTPLPAAEPPAPLLGAEEEVYRALTLGVRDYVVKNGFGDVVIGLSGGIDSSLVATIAADALGADRVHGVAMPSRFSSPQSHDDAEELASRLGIDFRTIEIEPAHSTMLGMLAPAFGDRPEDVTEENLQSRLRGVILMALSNKHGWLVLTTGNKSELAVGYSTLYGDTAGGFSVIKDVPKTLVYRLCRFRNAAGPGSPIADAVLTKPPSADRKDQRDDDSLPPYDVLDPLLAAYVEEDRTAAELVDAGFDEELVARITRLVDAAEYKRRQSPIGVRVTPKAFGRDRRMPITNAYR